MESAFKRDGNPRLHASDAAAVGVRSRRAVKYRGREHGCGSHIDLHIPGYPAYKEAYSIVTISRKVIMGQLLAIPAATSKDGPGGQVSLQNWILADGVLSLLLHNIFQHVRRG